MPLLFAKKVILKPPFHKLLVPQDDPEVSVRETVLRFFVVVVAVQHENYHRR
jgi:hypothetical protein